MKAVLLATVAIIKIGVAVAGISVVAGSAIRVIDGDTVALGQEHIRFESIDAPEIFHPHCPAERALGERAKAELEQIIAGKRVTITRHGIGYFGRTLAHLSVDGKDIGVMLIAEGLALPYHHGARAHHRRTAHWCGLPRR